MKRIALPIILATGLLAQVASAQSSSTPTIGYYNFDVPTGQSAWVCGFVTKKEYQGVALSVAPGAPVGGEPTTVITQTGAGFGSFPLHYIEILGVAAGAEEGKIMDIHTNDANSITVLGTITAATPNYCVRAHVTLETLFSSLGATWSDYADNVTLFGSDGAPKSYFTTGGAGTWVADDFTTDANDTIVYPGQGYVLYSDLGNELTTGGNAVSYVKSGPTQIPLYYADGSANFIGMINPLVATDPLDPLYALVSSPTTTGSQTNLTAAGFPALEGYTDSVTLFVQGGDLDPLIAYFTDGVGGMLFDDFSTPAPLATLRNGYSAAVVLGTALDKTITLSQQHPN